jgi:hypothetical protein
MKGIEFVWLLRGAIIGGCFGAAFGLLFGLIP